MEQSGLIGHIITHPKYEYKKFRIVDKIRSVKQIDVLEGRGTGQYLSLIHI